MKSFSTEAKVGLLAIVAVFLAMYFIARINDIPGGAERGQGYELYAELDDVTGIYKATGVYIAGVKVGFVEDIVLKRSDDGEMRARLRLRIDKNVELPSDSTLVTEPSGLLGDKNLVIVPGRSQVSEASRLKDENTIKTGPPSPDLDEIMRRADDMTRDIKDVTTVMRDSLGSEEAEERLTSILTNIERFSADMAEVSASNRDALEEVVANLKILTEELRDVAARTNEGVDASFEDLEKAADKLDTTLASVSSISRKIDDGEGTIGKLINDSETADGLDTAIEGVNDIVERVNRIRIFVDYHNEALAFGPTFGFEPKRGLKNYLGIRVQPSPDYYYNLELVDDPRGKITTKSTTYTETDEFGNVTDVHTVEERKVEDQFTVTAQFARQLHNATFRLGLKESTGGVGFDYDIVPDKFSVSADAFAFSRENENPHLKMLARYDVQKHIFVVGGVDDLISIQDNRSFFMGAGFTFNDDDLKFVMGALPIP